jgi:hypothetical protein
LRPRGPTRYDICALNFRPDARKFRFAARQLLSIQSYEKDNICTTFDFKHLKIDKTNHSIELMDVVRCGFDAIVAAYHSSRILRRAP